MPASNRATPLWRILTQAFVRVRPAWAAASAHASGESLLLLAAGDDNTEDVPTVRAGRRREVQPAGPEGRERADAPTRRREEEAEPSPPRTSGGGGGAFRPRRPTGGGGPAAPMPKIPLLWIGIALLLLLCCVIAFFIFATQQGGEGPAPAPAATSAPPVAELPRQFTATPTERPVTATATPPLAATATATAASRARPTATAPSAAATATAAVGAAPAAKAPTWTIMLYQDATDKALDKDIFLDLNEAERAGSSERVQIV
ncbi:MAG: hypothetical protein WHX53_13725, partial [Anaerolineae bacterium]